MGTFVVTGSSTGIGHAAAKALIERGHTVFGSVRKDADGARVKAELGANYTPLLFDVTDEAAIARAAAEVRAALNGRKLSGLVNNAGIAVAGPLLHLPIEDFPQAARGQRHRAADGHAGLRAAAGAGP